MIIYDQLRHPSIKFKDAPVTKQQLKPLVDNQVWLRSIYLSWYKKMLDARLEYGDAYGLEVEIDGLPNFFKQIHPHIDIHLDKVPKTTNIMIDAMDMDLPEESVSAVYGHNIFYKLPRPRCFFYELDRVLKAGGVCVLIEPNQSVISRICSSLLRSSNRCDKDALHWELTVTGKTSIPNEALSYITFVRDYRMWMKEFPNLSIVHTRTIPNTLTALIGGAFGGKQLLPTIFHPIIKLIDKPLNMLSSLFSMQKIIVIKKDALS